MDSILSNLIEAAADESGMDVSVHYSRRFSGGPFLAQIDEILLGEATARFEGAGNTPVEALTAAIARYRESALGHGDRGPDTGAGDS